VRRFERLHGCRELPLAEIVSRDMPRGRVRTDAQLDALLALPTSEADTSRLSSWRQFSFVRVNAAIFYANVLHAMFVPAQLEWKRNSFSGLPPAA
jgi:hypothetical protein